MLLFWSVFFLFYVWHTLGVTIGLHRLLSHRAFRCPKAVEYFWVLGAYLAFQASPIWWATMHRAHHKHVETPLDPHSPRFGIFRAYTFYAHFGGNAVYPEHIDPSAQSPDLMKDPVYRWLERTESRTWYGHYTINPVICITFRVLLFIFFGPTVALASVLAAVVAFNVPLIFNILSHIPMLGYKNFSTADDSVNIWWLALITMGDAWHNNHHAFPGCARAGLRPLEFDISWQVLKLLRSVGLASELNERFKLPVQNIALTVDSLEAMPIEVTAPVEVIPVEVRPMVLRSK